MSKLVRVLIIVLAAALVSGGAYYWFVIKAEKPLTPEEKAVKSAGQIVAPEVIVPSNPFGEKLPDLNPVNKANPFKDVYKNPF